MGVLRDILRNAVGEKKVKRKREFIAVEVTDNLGRDILDLINAQEDQSWGGRSNLLKFALWNLYDQFGAVNVPRIDRTITLDAIKNELHNQPRNIVKIKRLDKAEIKREEMGW